MFWSLDDFIGFFYLTGGMIVQNEKIRIDRAARSIRFGKDLNQYALYFQPKGEQVKDELVLFIHGGGWSIGRPTEFQFIGKFFANLGYHTVMPGYRLSPVHKFTHQVEDIFSSLKIGIEEARKNGWQGSDILISGQSAGGHLATLMAFNKEELKKYEINQKNICGLISMSGPVDFSKIRYLGEMLLVKNIVGAGGIWEKANPIAYVDGDEEFPVLCIHGGRDILVEPEQSISLVEKVNSKRPGMAELILVEKGQHFDHLRLFIDEIEETRQLRDWLYRRIESRAKNKA